VPGSRSQWRSATTHLTRQWLWLAVINLAIGTSMAVVLVVAKTPALSSWLGLSAVFPVALVYHVNFTILLWVSTCAAWCWSLCFKPWWAGFDRLALGLAALATLVLLVSLLGSAKPVLSNYVPVIDSASFFAGLALFILAITLMVLNRFGALWQALRSAPVDPSWLFALAALAWLVAVAVLGVAWVKLAPVNSLANFAELLFWGFGHALQAVNLLLLAGGWCWLSGYSGAYYRNRWVQWMVLTALLAVLLMVFWFSPESPEYRALFTYWMRFFSLPVVIVVALPTLRQVLFGRDWLLGAVRISVLLFLLGVFIGAAIRADNLLVPAHYHAVTGALNLVLMGLFYRVLPIPETRVRLCRWQLNGYALGVVTLVAGLGLSGWLGVGRKLAGSAQGLEGFAQLASMSLMGCGGLIALLGCFLFLFQVIRIRGPLRAPASVGPFAGVV